MKSISVFLMTLTMCGHVCAQYHDSSSPKCDDPNCTDCVEPAPHRPCQCDECRRPRHVFVRVPKKKGGGLPESGPDGPSGPPPGGAFVQPPPTGTTVEGGRSLGLRGMAITMPKLRLELPSIELPSLMHIRHSTRMRLEEADAPYMQAPARPAMPAMLRASGRGESAKEEDEPTEDPVSAAPESAREREAIDDLMKKKQELDKKCLLLQEKINAVDLLMKQLECVHGSVHVPTSHFPGTPYHSPTHATSSAQSPERLPPHKESPSCKGTSCNGSVHLKNSIKNEGLLVPPRHTSKRSESTGGHSTKLLPPPEPTDVTTNSRTKPYRHKPVSETSLLGLPKRAIAKAFHRLASRRNTSNHGESNSDANRSY